MIVKGRGNGEGGWWWWWRVVMVMTGGDGAGRWWWWGQVVMRAGNSRGQVVCVSVYLLIYIPLCLFLSLFIYLLPTSLLRWTIRMQHFSMTISSVFPHKPGSSLVPTTRRILRDWKVFYVQPENSLGPGQQTLREKSFISWSDARPAHRLNSFISTNVFSTSGVIKCTEIWRFRVYFNLSSALCKHS